MLRYQCLAVPCMLLLIGCSTAGTTANNTVRGRIEICKAGDQKISSQGQCLQDDAACYQLANGKWCTGERGNQCPAGSTLIIAGTACPSGTRCFKVGESLLCGVNYR